MQNAQASIRVEPATKSQVPLILYFIRQLAEFEKLLDKVTADEARIKESLFGEKPCAEVLIAHLGDQPLCRTIDTRTANKVSTAVNSDMRNFANVAMAFAQAFWLRLRRSYRTPLRSPVQRQRRAHSRMPSTGPV